MELVVVVVIGIYIIYLRFTVANLKKEIEVVKKEKSVYISNKIDGYIKKINELQENINIILDNKNIGEEENSIHIKNEQVNNVDILEKKHNEIVEKYISWQELLSKKEKEREISIDRYSKDKKQELEKEIITFIDKVNELQKSINNVIPDFIISKSNSFVLILDPLEKLKEKQKYLIEKYEVWGNIIKNKNNDFNIKIKELKEKERIISQKERKISDEYKKLQEEHKLIENILSVKIKEYPLIATVLADYNTAKEKAVIEYLKEKRRPAYSAADKVAEIRREKNKGFEQLYAYKWELSYLHSLFPWIEEIETDIVRPVDFYREVPSSNEDHVLNWVSPEEYNRLNTKERNQLALDRYIKSTKSKWVIGRDYERYIGYLYEKKGYKVKYFGIEEGLEDLGRDLICFRGNDIHIVQCKCWSEKKEIHEKHINQLFGTTVMYYLSEINAHGNLSEFYNYIKEGRIIPVFVTTTKFSNTARKFANSLNVLLMNVPLEDYPMIKCNINRNTGERIYHLPFDQQYDKCIINPAEGEFYAKTVKEAEENGFRRAMRWRGN